MKRQCSKSAVWAPRGWRLIPRNHDPWSRTWKPQDKASVQQLFRCGVCDVAEERSAGCQRALQAGQRAQSSGCIRSTHTHHGYSTPSSSRRQREDRVLKARDRTTVVQRSIRTSLTKDDRTPEVHSWPRGLKMYILHKVYEGVRHPGILTCHSDWTCKNYIL